MPVFESKSSDVFEIDPDDDLFSPPSGTNRHQMLLGINDPFHFISYLLGLLEGETFIEQFQAPRTAQTSFRSWYTRTLPQIPPLEGIGSPTLVTTDSEEDDSESELISPGFLGSDSTVGLMDEDEGSDAPSETGSVPKQGQALRQFRHSEEETVELSGNSDDP
jgi:hypothetical protein